MSKPRKPKPTTETWICPCGAFIRGEKPARAHKRACETWQRERGKRELRPCGFGISFDGGMSWAMVLGGCVMSARMRGEYKHGGALDGRRAEV